VAAGLFAGFVLLAATDAWAIALFEPVGAAGIRLRAVVHLFDAAETLGVGALVALAVGALVRFVRLPRWATVCVAVATAVAIVLRFVGDDLTRFAAHLLEGALAPTIFVLTVALIGVVAPALLLAASLLSRRPRLRFLPVAAAIGALVTDQLLYRDDYLGVHGLVALGAALLGGAGLAPLAERTGRALTRRTAGRAALVLTGLFALFGVACPPSNDVRFELFRQPCAIGPWLLATTLWSAPRLHAPVALAASPWETDRSGASAIAPTAPPLLPRDAVVVLVTIDALRADVVSDPANASLFPTLTALKRDGVVFTHASAAGGETAVSLGALFSGLYYSERRWTDHGVGSTRYLFLADDPAPRFPQLLSDHGVVTANYSDLYFLGEEFGVIRGFRDERFVVQSRRKTDAAHMILPLLERLEHPVSGPVFLYAHLLDPHRPYDRGRKDGTDFERYLSEVAIADAALAQVVRLLELGYGKRWALFVSADHGEAFGEHDTTDHSKTLYEELVHVPLLARSPVFPPRTVDERVGLVDLGPTILDLFGVATPATFNGESLAPILAGGTRTFTRPLIAEGRLRRSLTQQDGFKVIEDARRKVVEAYDLVADPGESRNVFDGAPERADPALARLRAFFATHTLREPGYEPPYRP
jgi:hypothetical protein